MYESNTGTNKAKLIVIAILAGVALILGISTVLSAMTIVDTGKVGVVTNYGKVTGRELTEGMAWHAPLGIESVTQYDIKTLKNDQNAAAATKDLQDVNGTVVLNYRLERGKVSEIHQNVGAGYKKVLINPAIQEVFKASTAKYTAMELISNRQQLKTDVVNGLKDRLATRGIVVEDVSITDLGFSKEFTKAIEDRQVAQQQAERAKFNLERAITDAKAQEAQSESLSDAYLRKLAIEAWDGKMPQSVGGNTFLGIPLR